MLQAVPTSCRLGAGLPPCWYYRCSALATIPEEGPDSWPPHKALLQPLADDEPWQEQAHQVDAAHQWSLLGGPLLGWALASAAATVLGYDASAIGVASGALALLCAVAHLFHFHDGPEDLARCAKVGWTGVAPQEETLVSGTGQKAAV